MQDDFDPTKDAKHLLRTCDILESIAKGYQVGSPEQKAIEDAAWALNAVHQRKSLRTAFLKLKFACGGKLSEEMKADLRGKGINPDELEADDDV